jgi:hypothetical protein
MKPLFAALMAGLLSGCAAEPWRFAENRSGPLGDSPNRTATFNTSAAQHGGPEATNDATRQSTKRPKGLIDPLVDRIPLLSSAYLDPTISTTGIAQGHPYSDRQDPSSVQMAPLLEDGHMIEPVSFEENSQQPLVYLPDQGGSLLPSGRQAIWVGVEGTDSDPVDVLIDDGDHCGPQRPFFARMMNHPLVYNLITDERNFYSCCSLEWLAVGLGTSAILANTNLDEQFRESIHGPAHKNSTSLNWMKDLGTGQYVIPALAGIWVADVLINSTAPGERPIVEGLEEWSGRSLRGLIVGAVPVVALQSIIGSSRPGMSSAGSRWTPFQSSHGVSGHAFVGAVPFWTAAQMTDCVPLEVGFYAMGSLAGIARLQNDSHYLSQVVMGWWIAGLSVAAVDCTEWQKRSWQVMPMVTDGGAGLALMHQW